MDFRWNEWNVEHIGLHGVSPSEAELVVQSASRPFPRKIHEDKWLVWGRGNGGRLIQVIFVLDENDTAFVIHSRPLTDREKRQYRRRRR